MLAVSRSLPTKLNPRHNLLPYLLPYQRKSAVRSMYAFVCCIGLALADCGSETELNTPITIPIPNLSARIPVEVGQNQDIDSLSHGLTYGVSSYLAAGSSTQFKPSGLGNQPYFATLIPVSGNPDLYRYSWTGLSWLYRAGSANSEMLVERLSGSNLTTNDYFYLASGVPSGFTFSMSWEVNGRLELDVPYLNQNDIPTIGSSACASASTAMVLAYHARIRAEKNSLIAAAQACFDRTSTLSTGLSSASALTVYLQNTYSISASYDEIGMAQTYAIIQSEIRAGRPVIFGSHALTPAGHYLVITGFNGNNYQTAKIIVNDPNGRWLACSSGTYCYSTRDNGKGNEYSFAAAMSSPLHRIFLIRP